MVVNRRSTRADAVKAEVEAGVVRVWGERRLADEETAVWDFGPLRLWCRRHLDELWVTHQHVEAQVGGAADCSPPETRDWRRWALKSNAQSVRLLPIFPDRPLVVKPEYAFNVVMGARVKIYVGIPVWVRVQVDGRRPVVLHDVPTVVLSKTWFGSFTDGELCYWLTTAAPRSVQREPERPYRAICPVRITNRADGDLRVEKLAMRLRRSSIFWDQGQLWSDEMQIDYQGGKLASRIRVTGKPPEEAPEAERLTPPLETEGRGFVARTFASFWEATGRNGAQW